jgi:anti-sigma factor RsiW
MSCQKIRELLTAYQHRELDAATDALVFSHLGVCAPCREELAAANDFREALRAAFEPPLELPPAVIAGVRQATRRERRAWVANLLQTLLRPVVWAPTAAVIVVAAGILTHAHPAQTTAPLTADYFVRQHVVHTMSLQSGDRTWSAYVLTSGSTETADAVQP